MTINWQTISYLKHGTARQQAVYSAIESLNILELLKKYNPAIVSTINIDLDTPESDIDVICQYSDKDEFKKYLSLTFSRYEGFNFAELNAQNDPIIIEFVFNGFIFEIYGDSQPVTSQNAYRHLTTMKRLLDLGGDKVKEAVKALRCKGFKGELAFCHYLGLSGDPFERLLELESYSDIDLENIIKDSKFLIDD